MKFNMKDSDAYSYYRQFQINYNFEQIQQLKTEENKFSEKSINAYLDPHRYRNRIGNEKLH